MDEQSTQTPDAPVTPPAPAEPAAATPPAPAGTPDAPVQQPAEPAGTPEAPVAPAPADPVVTEEEEFPQYFNQPLPQAPRLDFSNLPVGDDNLIDPNALAGSINQQMAAMEERATLRAQQNYQEQRNEERSWEKAYESHPELKSNKELRDLVHRARLGEVADLLSRTQDPSSVKLPTPGQVADRFFKQMGTAKQEGMQQATANVTVQQSAHLETAGTRNNPTADSRVQARQNINNANHEVAVKARTDLLKSMVFGDD